jgi:transcriptional regulator with XRE-family HTH domain
MQLAAYLQTEGLSLSEFARRIGAKNARTVQRYTKHGRMPSSRMMMEIARATSGAVQPNDFFAGPAAR